MLTSTPPSPQSEPPSESLPVELEGSGTNPRCELLTCLVARPEVHKREGHIRSNRAKQSPSMYSCHSLPLQVYARKWAWGRMHKFIEGEPASHWSRSGKNTEVARRQKALMVHGSSDGAVDRT